MSIKIIASYKIIDAVLSKSKKCRFFRNDMPYEAFIFIANEEKFAIS